MMKLGICMEKKNPPSFLNSHFITSSVFPVFLQQIRTGKIHTDYAPNDTLYTCFFPPNLHIIHAVVFEAVTGWEIFKYFLSLTCTDFGGCVLERLLFTPRFLIGGYKKKTTTHNVWFLLFAKVSFSPQKLPVMWSAVVCVYVFWL